jgi:hypothetical protein
MQLLLFHLAITNYPQKSSLVLFQCQAFKDRFEVLIRKMLVKKYLDL